MNTALQAHSRKLALGSALVRLAGLGMAGLLPALMLTPPACGQTLAADAGKQPVPATVDAATISCFTPR